MQPQAQAFVHGEEGACVRACRVMRLLAMMRLLARRVLGASQGPALDPCLVQATFDKANYQYLLRGLLVHLDDPSLEIQARSWPPSTHF